MIGPNRHRRLAFVAAGLMMGSVAMAGCKHASGERAVNTGAANDSSATASPGNDVGRSAATDSAYAANPSNPGSSAGNSSAANPAVSPSASHTTRASRSSPRRHRVSARESTDYSAPAATARASSNAKRNPYETSSRADNEPASRTDTSVNNTATPSLGVSGAGAVPPYATCTPAANVSTSAPVTSSIDAASAKASGNGDSAGVKPVAPENRADTTMVRKNSSVVDIAPSATPCGWPAGARGAFLNDAQVAHAALIGNSVDSAVSLGIQNRTHNAAVRAYAEMMVRDHSGANGRIAGIIDRTHIAPAENDISTAMLRDTVGHTFAAQPMGMSRNDTYSRDTSMSAKHDAALMNRTQPSDTAMSKHDATMGPNAPSNTPLSDEDRAYIDYQVQFHQQVLDALDARLIPFAFNTELRAALQESRAVVQQHLDRARAIQAGRSEPTY